MQFPWEEVYSAFPLVQPFIFQICCESMLGVSYQPSLMNTFFLWSEGTMAGYLVTSLYEGPTFTPVKPLGVLWSVFLICREPGTVCYPSRSFTWNLTCIIFIFTSFISIVPMERTIVVMMVLHMCLLQHARCSSMQLINFHSLYTTAPRGRYYCFYCTDEKL